MFTSTISMGKTIDRGMIVGARQSGLSISETADLLGFSRTTVFNVCTEWCLNQKTSVNCRQKCSVNESGHGRKAKVVKGDG